MQIFGASSAVVRLGKLSACLLTISAFFSLIAGETGPNPSELDIRDASEKLRVITHWASLAEQIRARGDKMSSSSPNWVSVKKRLVSESQNDLNVVPLAAGIFNELNEPSPECVEFCHEILRSSDIKVEEYCPIAVRLLGAVHANDKVSTDLIIRAAERGQKEAFEVLISEYRSNASIKAVFIDWLERGDPAIQERALSSIAVFDLTKDDAAKIVSTVQGLLTHPRTGTSIDSARHFCRAMCEQVYKFRRCLDKPSDDLIRLLNDSDIRVSSSAAEIILISSSSFQPEVVDLLMSRFASVSTTESNILAAIGYLPIDPNSRLNQAALQAMEGKPPQACAGVVSIYLRTGGDFESIRKRIRSGKNGKVTLDPQYLSGHERYAGNIHLPGEWKQLWSETFASAHEALLPLIRVFPETPETTWMIEQSIKEPKLGAALIDGLWSIRHERTPYTSATGLREWLGKYAVESRDIARGIMAAALVAIYYNDKSLIISRVEKVSSEHSQVTKIWSPIIEAIAEIDPTSKVLQKYRDNVSAPATNGASRGDALWWTWLIDLCCGKEVGAPPIDSLNAVLETEGPNRPAWLDAFAGAGKNLYPWIDSFRRPDVFFSGSKSSMANTMEFLGILDRKEMEKRVFEGKGKRD